MINTLKKRIKELNEVIINNAFNIKKSDKDDLDRKFDWAKNECSGIKGTFIDKEGNITFKI